jgi:hypothetical protein
MEEKPKLEQARLIEEFCLQRNNMPMRVTRESVQLLRRYRCNTCSNALNETRAEGYHEDT